MASAVRSRSRHAKRSTWQQVAQIDWRLVRRFPALTTRASGRMLFTVPGLVVGCVASSLGVGVFGSVIVALLH